MKVTIYVCDNLPEGLWERPSARHKAIDLDCPNTALESISSSGGVVSSSADNFRDLIENDVPTISTEYAFFLHARHRLSIEEVAECLKRHRDSAVGVSLFPSRALVGEEWQHHLENIDQRIILSNTFPVRCRPHPKAVVPFIGIVADAGILTNFAQALRSRSIACDEEYCRMSESVSIMLARYLKLQSEGDVLSCESGFVRRLSWTMCNRCAELLQKVISTRAS